jgi:hypothetical protein
MQQPHAKGQNLVTPPPFGDSEDLIASARQLAAHQAIAAQRQRSLDELGVRRRQIEDQHAAFLAAEPPTGEIKRVSALIRRTAAAGEMIAHVFRFPSEYCPDGDRAVNDAGHDWPVTLQCLARAHFDLLHREFTPLGFHIAAPIATRPMLMPGDVSLMLSWRD